MCCKEGECHCKDEEHGAGAYLRAGFSLLMLIAGILMSHFDVAFFAGNPAVELVWYVAAFLPVGFPVMKEAAEQFGEKDFFNEFTLMTIACIGAFIIGKYAEAVGVMLFYCVGEMLQDRAVDRAKDDIARLIDVRSEQARVIRNGEAQEAEPGSVAIGETIEVWPGERVPLDGKMESAFGTFDTSALTGESVPRTVERGGEVLAGMIATGAAVRIKVEKAFGDSALSRIMKLVEESAERKAHTELFIRRFARVYTPAVIALAALLVILPWIVSLCDAGFHYSLKEWVYRSLVFLVISCPCALVVSVPLGYFAGIGAASKAGILFKGGNFLDAIARVTTVAFDKTGTLTTGRFSVDGVYPDGISEKEMLSLIASAESRSSHPLARVVVEYARERGLEVAEPQSVEEITGFGVRALIDGRVVTAGNMKLLQREGVAYPSGLYSEAHSMIACSIDGKYAGYVSLSDVVKPDALQGIEALHKLGVEEVVMLSGDREQTVGRYAEMLGIREAHGGLLPQDKAAYVEEKVNEPGKRVAFVGDGMNDAPVLALSDVGIAMGGLGSDAAIETADVVIQSDAPSRVATAIKIGRTTRAIVKENIVGAIGVKVAVLALGAAGIASLWAAVFADVGIALLAVLNSMRILWKKY